MEGQTNRDTGNPAERTYWLICGTPDCINRTQPRPDFSRAGWHVRESELVDGELWICPDCRGVDWPLTTATRWREEWVSWFVDGRAEHFLCDSPTGRAITAKLAELDEPRHCSIAGCERPARGRSETCSESHARALRRTTKKAREARDRERIRRPKLVSGPDLPGTPETRTSDAPLPGTMTPVIADTADTDRRCANCGRDITHRRADAAVCGDRCRKALARRAERAGEQLVLDLVSLEEIG